MNLYYTSMFGLSLVLLGIYALIYKKRFSIFITLIFAFVPIANLGYFLSYTAKNVDAAIVGIKMVYLGGCYIHLFQVYAIFHLCNLKIKKWIRMALLAFTTTIFIFVLTIGHNGLFYKEVSGEIVNGVMILNKNYGLIHTIYYVQLVLYMIFTLSATFYAIRKKNDVSRHNIHYMLTFEIVCVLMFFAGKIFGLSIELMPAAYIICITFLLIICRRIVLYDVTDTVIDAIAMNGDTGFISFDSKYNYLGSNNIAKEIFPALKQLKVDNSALKNSSVNEEIVSKIKAFSENKGENFFFKNHHDKIYQININRLLDGDINSVFILYIQDDTKDQKYISLLNKFNDKLQDEVNSKTERIVQMHDNLIMSMATMVESRDNSTGGHIRRTSEVVSILIEEIIKDRSIDGLHLTSDFCHNLIKAAPMHDLGKISVPDAILQKPGKFTDEEFEKMKTHAAEGAKIVHEILKGTDDLQFHLMAENVAHYHHERWDGSGYPEGLKGEEIPLEARIMAVADVYDALVSKRVYKEAMTFEKADSIMMESFGKHFDKQLEKYYVAARARLESYYSSVE